MKACIDPPWGHGANSCLKAFTLQVSLTSITGIYNLPLWIFKENIGISSEIQVSNIILHDLYFLEVRRLSSSCLQGGCSLEYNVLRYILNPDSYSCVVVKKNPHTYFAQAVYHGPYQGSCHIISHITLKTSNASLF